MAIQKARVLVAQLRNMYTLQAPGIPPRKDVMPRLRLRMFLSKNARIIHIRNSYRNEILQL
jgi:hypothetical protein